MQAHARFALGLVALLAALLALPSRAVAAPAPVSPSLLRSASWHGRAIQKPISTIRTAAVPQLTRLPGWSSGPARRGLGFARAGGSVRVREVQRLLVRIGYRPGPVDGRFGARTQAAVIDFQHKHSLPQGGAVGSRTLLSLRERARLHWPPGWTAGALTRGSGYRHAGGSVRVRRLQRQLARLGYDSGGVDGLYGPRTQRAVTGFERSRGLPADGVAGLDTLRALGLIAVAPRHLTPNQTSRPRPAAPAAPRAVHAHRTRRLPVLPLIAGLALLGLLTLWTSYLRTLARIRRAQAEPPSIDHARLGSGNGDGVGWVGEEERARAPVATGARRNHDD